MVFLDEFKTVMGGEHGECDCCGDAAPLFSFYEESEERISPTQSPDCDICVSCFFESEGRFKNVSHSALLREYETVVDYAVKDGMLELITSGPLGKFTHVFYLEPSLLASEQTRRGGKSLRFNRVQTLQGRSEIYTSDGDFVAEPSSFSDVALKILAQTYPVNNRKP